VAGFVPAAPVAVKAKIVVPAVFKMNCIPAEFSGLPERAIDCPFSVRLMELAFCVCQLSITALPCFTVVALTLTLAVGLAGAGGVGAETGVGAAATGKLSGAWVEPPPQPVNTSVNTDPKIANQRKEHNPFPLDI
jgi:hypothetical protein